MDRTRRRILKNAAAVSATMTLPWSAMAAADDWPAKKMRLLVPFPPGGGIDLVARTVAVELSKRLGETMWVDNRPGGNMFIGAVEVARSAPDGYTFLLALDSIFTINPYAYDKLPYDPVNSFSPVSLITTQAQWYVARPGIGISSMRDLLKIANDRPGFLNYGCGSPAGQLTAELLKSLTGARMTIVPYKGSSPAVLALLSGEVDVVGADLAPLLQHIKAGKAVPLGQTGVTRLALLPQVPTMLEQGLDGFETLAWSAMFAPAKTPSAVIARLNHELASVLAQANVRESILALGYEARASSPEALAERSHADGVKWQRVIRAANFKLG